MRKIEADFREIEKKIQHHQKMMRFYREYQKAVVTVESFHNREADLVQNDVRFCAIRNCTDTFSNHDYNNGREYCARHEFQIERRNRTTKDYLDD